MTRGALVAAPSFVRRLVRKLCGSTAILSGNVPLVQQWNPWNNSHNGATATLARRSTADQARFLSSYAGKNEFPDPKNPSSSENIVSQEAAPTALPPSVLKIEAPEGFTEQLVGLVMGKLPKSASGVNITMKRAVNKADIDSFKEQFDEILDQYPEFKEQLKTAKDSAVVFVSGLHIPKLPYVPSKQSETDDTLRTREAVIAQIASGLVMTSILDGGESQMAKKGNIFDLLFVTEDGLLIANRFDSKELDWHIDGWANYIEKLVCLFCINGSDATVTEAITSDQIISYFQKNGKQDVLKRLAEPFTFGTEPGSTNKYAPVLDKDGNICYADYAFIGSSSSSDLQALKEFKQCLQEISPAFSASLQNGDMLIINNQQAVHRKIVIRDQETKERAVLRARLDDAPPTATSSTKAFVATAIQSESQTRSG